MLHPALTQALATARTEDRLREAARWHTIRRARLERGSPVTATSTAGRRSTLTPIHVPDRSRAGATRIPLNPDLVVKRSLSKCEHEQINA